MSKIVRHETEGPAAPMGGSPTPWSSALHSSADALSITDEALVARTRAGDPAAGDALVRRFTQPLLRYLQRLVGDDAEELHQQTWMSVLDNLEKFDPAAADQHGPGAFKAWIFRIATNKANDLWRSRGRERVAKQGLRLVTETESPWAGERAEGTEMQQKLRAAIERLPENQRQILSLRYYSNMKFVDIAKLIGCPLNTALGRVHKAMIKLRQLLEEPPQRAAAKNQTPVNEALVHETPTKEEVL
jgi:RNA polymerase sigma-70 factor (ECF subfamily)